MRAHTHAHTKKKLKYILKKLFLTKCKEIRDLFFKFITCYWLEAKQTLVMRISKSQLRYYLGWLEYLKPFILIS